MLLFICLLCTKSDFSPSKQGCRKLFLVGGWGGGAQIEVWRPESSAAGARLYRGKRCFLMFRAGLNLQYIWMKIRAQATFHDKFSLKAWSLV